MRSSWWWLAAGFGVLTFLLTAWVVAGDRFPFGSEKLRSRAVVQWVTPLLGMDQTPADNQLTSTTTTPTPAPPPVGQIIVASQEGQSVTLVDAATDKVSKPIQIGVPAHGVMAGASGGTAWVFSNKQGETDFYLIDLIKGELRGSKRLRDGPSAAAVSSDGSRAFVALGAANEISFLSSAGLNEFGQVVLGNQTPGVQIRRQPDSLAVLREQAGDLLYVAGQGSGVVWALDAGSGKLISEIDIGGGPALLLAYPTGQRVYAVVDTLNQLVAIDPATQRVSARIDLPGRPAGAAVGPRGEVYVAGEDAAELWVVDPVAGKVTSQIPVGHWPSGVAISSDGVRLYVANRGDGTLSVIDVPTQQLLDTLQIGKDPVAVAFAPKVDPTATTTPTASTTNANEAVAPGLPTAAARPATATAPSPTPSMVPTPTPLPQGAQPPTHMPPGTVKETFVPGAEYPVAMAFAPDGRLFYNELRTGKIRVVENGVLQKDPFYQFVVAGEPETGLLGLALDPNFAQNHYVYVFYTSVAGGGTQSGGMNGPNQLVRLTDVGGKGTDLTPILRDLPSGPVHNAGTIHFGPDGKLYISIGDNDNGPNSQDLNSLAGKILRINPDGTIPDDNPFVGEQGAQPAIWAYGLRNSFGFAFHPISKALFANENGPGDNDEQNLIVAGGDYGWPPSGFQDKSTFIDPIAVFNPPISPTGQTFYVGDQIPEWKDELLYCNYHQGQLRRVHLAPGSFDRIGFDEVITPGCTLDVITGPDGALYYSDVNAIYRIRHTDAQALPAVASATQPTPAPTEALPPGTRSEDRDVDVSLTEWKIVPSRSVVPAGKIRFHAENLGATVHALRIVGKGIDVSTEEFGPGESRSIEVDLPPGSYELDCPVGNHAELGMVTSFTVIGP